MKQPSSRFSAILLITLCLQSSLIAQKNEPAQYVNPFIGTGRTQARSFWGAEGGTYPGAVAPWGFVQLTPETDISSARGYNYRDSSIYFFSCTGHMSGYPNGSSGHIHIMPSGNTSETKIGNFSRPFRHKDEKAGPGYYSVIFKDDGTMAEVTASVRAGMLLFTFPPGIAPRIAIGDIGKVTAVSDSKIQGEAGHAVIAFSSDFTELKETDGNYSLSFRAEQGKKTKILVRIGLSQVSFENSESNLESETAKYSFDDYRKQNLKRWNDELSVVEISDPSEDNKVKFYTALYHSMLLPWIISDRDGSYHGADRKIHMTKGHNQYGGFSPWDTFRSLHPLLSLIRPDTQNDIILSMLDYYEQTGRLPGGPMTGNHVLAIIADSWFKGIRGYDGSLALKAMQSTLDSASENEDMAAYLRLGYVPSGYSESVTKTVEYAYDDWIMARLSGSIVPDSPLTGKYLSRSYSYRNLFDPETLYMTPRLGNDFMKEPGYFGYKEGDKFSYTLFVPHNPVDLVNLSGGPAEFAARLDSALSNGLIYFDNEPVLHVPYLFNYAKAAHLTQKWVRTFMKYNYTNSPEGLPGNDDLGAMSSWFVFSALGFFPLCPGRPVYDAGSPLFAKATVHLPGNKKLIIRSENNGDRNIYVKSVQMKGVLQRQPWLTHEALLRGGEIVFTMNDNPEPTFSDFRFSEANSLTSGYSNIKVTGFSLPAVKAKPGEKVFIRFTAGNSGSTGTKAVKIYTDGKLYAQKNVLVEKDMKITDSIQCRLYGAGRRMIGIDSLPGKAIDVTDDFGTRTRGFSIENLKCPPFARSGSSLKYSYTLFNNGGYRDSIEINILLNDSLIQRDQQSLAPGESAKIFHGIKISKPGFYNLKIRDKISKVRIYEENSGATIIDLPIEEESGLSRTKDYSGFDNQAFIIREDSTSAPLPVPFESGDKCYIRLDNSPSLSGFGESITVMAWIRPGSGNKGLTDIITRGDFIALQSFGNRSLSFFAGGWGRGSCEALLPFDWANNWHHVAGVSDGHMLKLYIDGVESARFVTETAVSLSYTGRWTIGRNEEFPGERMFHGSFKNVRIFAEALTPDEIKLEMEKK